VGTSASVVDKGSLQIEAGYQRSIATTGNSDDWMTMVRWGLHPNFEIRPYHTLNFADPTNIAVGLQAKATLYSSDTSVVGLLASSDLSLDSGGSSLIALWDFSGEKLSGWFNGGTMIDNTTFDLTPIVLVGTGTEVADGHSLYVETGWSATPFVSTGYCRSFGSYQLDLFGVGYPLADIPLWQTGLGISWKIR